MRPPSAPTDSAEESAGTKTRTLIASSPGAGYDRVDAIAIEAANRFAVDERGRRERAIPQAIDRFDVKVSAVLRVVDLDSVLALKMGNEIFATHGLTGFGAAKLQHRAIDGRSGENRDKS